MSDTGTYWWNCDEASIRSHWVKEEIYKDWEIRIWKWTKSSSDGIKQGKLCVAHLLLQIHELLIEKLGWGALLEHFVYHNFYFISQCGDTLLYASLLLNKRILNETVKYILPLECWTSYNSLYLQCQDSLK